MNRIVYVALLTSALLLAGCDQMQGLNIPDNTADNTAPDAATTTESKTLATVNGTTITQAVLDIYVQQRKPKPGGAEANSDSVILNELINLELMRQDGISKGLDKHAEAIAILDHQQRSVMAGISIREFMKNHPVSDEQIQEFYDAKIGKGNAEYKAKHILLKSEEDAKQVIAMLDNGSDFAELAKEKSTGPSGKNGGDLGWFGAKQMVKPFTEAVATLEKGSYSKEPVTTRFGWHVIYLEDTRKSSPPPFEDIKDRLRMLMLNKALQEYVENMKETAAIEITPVEEAVEEPSEAPAKTDEAVAADAETAATTSEETMPAEEASEETTAEETAEPISDDTAQ